MQVILDKIEQLPNGDARVSFYSNFTNHHWGHIEQVPYGKLFSITVQKYSAWKLCRFLVENSFGSNRQIYITFTMISGKEWMEIVSVSLYDRENIKNRTEMMVPSDSYTDKQWG